MHENKQYFFTGKKEKDEYDKEYDKGKLKKVRKKKEYTTKNDFQSTYNLLSKSHGDGYEDFN